MHVFISGGCKNGKSTFALRTALELAPEAPRYYVATMLPHDAEDEERIRRHCRAREGLGFETIERGLRLADIPELVRHGAVFVLDSVTALLENAMFPYGGEMQPDAAKVCEAELAAFLDGVENAVMISDYIYSNAFRASESTRAYMRGLARLDRLLAARCVRTVEICAGTAAEYGKCETEREADGMELIIGGAHQGKLGYAKSVLGVTEAEICFCSETEEPELAKRCVCGLERYLLGCIRRGEEPKLDDLRQDAVVIMEDIFCGLVPITAEERAWRELAGRTSAQLAARATRVTRIFCGLPQRLK